MKPTTPIPECRHWRRRLPKRSWNIPQRRRRLQTDDTVYNTYVLKADERGCATCHTDLREVLNGLPTRHMDINLVGDSELTVTNCVTCHRVTHEYAPEDYGLGS